MGDKDVTAIVSADLVHFRNTLLKLPMSKQKAIRSLPVDKEDICKDSKGIYFLNIRMGEDQSVKNDTSLRHVPLHEHLLELGRIDYVKAADGGLFPQITADKYGKQGPYIGDWWGRWLRQRG